MCSSDLFPSHDNSRIKFGPNLPGTGALPLNQYAVASQAAGSGSPAQVGLFKYNSVFGGSASIVPTPSDFNMYADLAEATSATINQIRQSFQVQRLLERDARGGTRYTEILRSHFGVISPDARLQRPEYLGGGETPIQINPIAQTSGTTVSGSDTPLATLSAIGTTVVNGHGFSQAFVEHGVIIGLAAVRAELSYQQGLRRMWSRSTRYDFYMPVFSHLGEQAVLNKEIYCSGFINGTDLRLIREMAGIDYYGNPT